LAERGQGWQGSNTQAYWLVVRVLLTPPAEAAASQKWKIIYLQVLSPELVQKWVGQVKFHTSFCASTYIQTESFPPG